MSLYPSVGESVVCSFDFLLSNACENDELQAEETLDICNTEHRGEIEKEKKENQKN